MVLEKARLDAQKTCMLVVGKDASTLSKLQGIANCVKNRTRKLYSPTDIGVLLAVVLPTPTFRQA